MYSVLFLFCLLKSLFARLFWNDWTSVIIPKVTKKTLQRAINQTTDQPIVNKELISCCGCKNFTDECFWWVKRNLNSLNAPSQARTGLWAAAQHNNSDLYESLSSSSKSHSSDKKKKHKLVYSGKASHLEQARMEGRVKRAGMTFASHPSEFVVKQSTRLTSTTMPPLAPSSASPLPVRDLEAAHPVCCQSYWSFWHDGPSEVPPRLGTHQSRGQGDTR